MKTNRRSFLRQSTLAGLGIILVPRNVLGRGFVAPSDKLRLGCIGVGGRGWANIQGCAASPYVDIVALCDVDQRQTEKAKNAYPDANMYMDYRKMMDSEQLDAVIISTPDHMHAIQGMEAIQRGLHVYIEKPLSHDIAEARELAQAARKHKVVTQMGNQGSSFDGVRFMQEWYQAGLIGTVDEVFVWTNRPVWPQGVSWEGLKNTAIPDGLDWNLWLGTAPLKNYKDNLVPFNWRGWWDYGTGALGDMACHLMEPAFTTLGLHYPNSVEASVGSVYTGPFRRAYFPNSCPPSSHIILSFPETEKHKEIKMHWMDGGIQPERPVELGAEELMGDGGNGVIIKGSKGSIMCDTYGRNPRLLPKSLNEQAKDIPQSIPRVEEGHHLQWINGIRSGFGKTELSSDFDKAGPLTESVLMGNLALRSFDYRIKNDQGNWDYPGRYIKLNWDGPNMRITNFEPANQFVKREYRTGW
jgi:predicted dehydrogenase